MGDPLARPPVVEALVEFRFSIRDRDWTIPGRLYDKVKAEFPERVEVRPPVILVGQPDGGMVPQAGVPERLQFKRRNGTAMIQVGPGLLVINHLRPYPSWPDFRGLVLKIYMQYQELNERLNVERVGGHVNQSFSAGRHPSAR